MSFDPNSNSILTDPEYLLRNPGYIKQAHDLLVQYGIIPAATGDAAVDSALADPTTRSEATANPYSTAALLRKSLATGIGNNQNLANAHGALFSGANANNNLHSQDAYQQGLSQAGGQLTQGLNTISSNRVGTVAGIWNRLSNATVDTAVPDTTAYPVAQPTVQTPTSYGGLATPQGAYTRTGPETPNFTPIKKPKLPGIGGMGHIT